MSAKRATVLVMLMSVALGLAAYFGLQGRVLAGGAKRVTPDKLVRGGSIPSCDRVHISRPLISLTFDDGYESFFKYGLPLLQKYGFKSTDYIISGYTDENPTYVTSPDIVALHDAGEEIASHTVSHPSLPTLTPNQINKELKDSQTYLQGILGVRVLDFASPYGLYNQEVIKFVKRYYRSHRGVERGYNTDANFNVYDIKSQALLESNTLAQVKKLVDYVKDHKVWLVLAYHSITPTPGPGKSTYNSYPANLEQHLQYIKQSGIAVKTVSQVLNEICLK